MAVPSFEDLADLVGRPADAESVVALIGVNWRKKRFSEYRCYFSQKSAGYSIMLEKERPARRGSLPWVQTVQFFSQGYEGFEAFAAPLAGGLRFGDSRAAVLAAMGTPERVGKPGFSSLLNKPIPEWVRFHVVGRLIHFQFGANGVDMVSVSLAPPTDGG